MAVGAESAAMAGVAVTPEAACTCRDEAAATLAHTVADSGREGEGEGAWA